jgi:hypothetical protein
MKCDMVMALTVSATNGKQIRVDIVEGETDEEWMYGFLTMHRDLSDH